MRLHVIKKFRALLPDEYLISGTALQQMTQAISQTQAESAVNDIE
jgi:uncharacterized tellurite resistance protein B-like protein